MGVLIEKAKKLLEADLESFPSVISDPIRDARTGPKIERYLYVCILEGQEKPKSVDWLYSLYKDQTTEEHDAMISRLDPLANALYAFYNYLGENNLLK